ncbi:histidine phosphatase family protein [Actinomadura graeca]|uniref:Histidine phosphatase family protein n=1 Tax=Actinomadura graeca TaxID=2750812 RepID=A0ABX8QVT0_9ACTN|nr:histidine phosphatase family protein [Actinomadura graeca]QXJ22728.1 histidine phosphatase family protein [Actinomadura graeca]
MTDQVRLWCMRHGESENIVTGASGAVPAAPLTSHGRHQAARAADELRNEAIAHVYSSTARRAHETAEIIAARLGAEVTASAELVEGGIGRSEGATDPNTRARAAAVLHAWVVDQDLSQRVADGEDGHQVIERVNSALAAIVSAHPGETIALVGHVASLTTALSALCGFGKRVWGTPLPPAIPFLVTWDGHSWQCPTWPGIAL